MSLSINFQPDTNSLNAAYRPIQFVVDTDLLIPIAFCDIYFNGVFYKTISTTYQTFHLEFDIQDAAQEYLKKYLPSNGGITFEPAPSLITSCFCRFRGSTTNSEGLIVPDTVAPIQGTLGVLPTPGTGLQSNTFYILNSTLQHLDNQSLAQHLASFKSGVWESNAWPLSHRPNRYRIASSDYWPIVYTGSKTLSCIHIYFKYKSGYTGTYDSCDAFPACPILSGVAIGEVDNGNGTQTFTFTWSTPDPSLTGIKIYYSIAGLGSFTSTAMLPVTSGQTLTLPIGLYDFKFETYGPCNPTMSSLYEDEGINPSCTDVTLPSPSMPDGAVLQPYSHTVAISGTAPFALGTVTKPSWMTVVISGSNLVFGGTPLFGDVATGISVSVQVTNCSSGTATYSDTIDVIDLPFIKSKVYNDLGYSLLGVTVTKMTSPAQLLAGPVDIPAGTFVTFLAPNMIGVDIQVNYGGLGSLTLPDAHLTSNGNTYLGTITPGFVIFSGVTIINGMDIHLGT